MSVDRPFNIYREQLSSLYHGLALWDPKPDENINEQPGHVSIGDVGYLDDGAFIRMFNVTRPWDDPSNKLPGKQGEYELINPSHSRNVRHKEVRQGEHYTPHVAKVDNVGADRHEDSLGQMYQCRFPHHGALLSLPHKGYRKDVRHLKAFENHIKDNVDSWLRWSKEMMLPVERMEDLIFVTGCTLVTSWAAAAFDGRKSEESDPATISLETRKSDGGGAQFFWRNIRGCVEYHNSPFDPNVKGSLPRNQCVFIRGFRAKRTFFRTIPMRAAAEPLPDDPDDRREDEIHVTRIPDSSKYRDPLVGILDYIIQKCNEDISPAEDIIAIAHDDDLRLIEGVETLTADAIEKFLHEKQMPLLIENGAASLRDSPGTRQLIVERHVSHGQMPQASHGQTPQVPHRQMPQASYGQTPQVPQRQMLQASHGQTPQVPQRQMHQTSYGQTPQVPQRQMLQASHGQTPQVPHRQMPQASYGQTPQVPHRQMPQASYGQTPQVPHKQILQASYGQTPQVPHAQMPRASYGQTPQVSQRRMLQASSGQTHQVPHGQMPRESYGQTPRVPHGQMPEASYGQTPQVPHRQMLQASYGQTPQVPQEQMPRESYGQTPQVPHGQMPEASYGQTPQVPHEQTTQESYGQMHQVPHGQMPQASYGQTPQVSHRQMPQASYGQTPQVPHGQMSPASYDQTPRVPHRQTPQASYGQTPQVSHRQMPQASYGQTPQVPHGQMSQASYDQAPQTPHGQMPQASYGQTSQVPDGQMPQMPYGQTYQPTQTPPATEGGTSSHDPQRNAHRQRKYER